jgi:hypothetical protein
MDSTENQEIFHPTAKEYTFFLVAHDRSDFRLKPSFNFCALSDDHNGIKLEVKSKRNYSKHTNTWTLNIIKTSEISDWAYGSSGIGPA